MPRSGSVILVAITALVFLSFRFTSEICTVFTRDDITPADSMLYDSLTMRAHPVFSADSVVITDTARIRYPYLTRNTNQYFPRYIQFHGSYQNFLVYALRIDRSLDSIATCGDRVRLFYSTSCEECDSTFYRDAQSFPYQFYFYRYHEIYAGFFSFSNINKIEVYINEENKTYLPSAGDLPVYAPSSCMQRKWYRKNVDYGVFFPVDFPATVGGDFIMTDKDEFIWREAAADRWIR